MARFLALHELIKPQRMQELAQHQQNTLLEWNRKAGGLVNMAIQRLLSSHLLSFAATSFARHRTGAFRR